MLLARSEVESGQGVQFMGVKGRRYKLLWSGNSDGKGGVGVLVKEELCKKVVKVRRKRKQSDDCSNGT